MTMEAYRYEDGSISYPGHPRSLDGSEPVDTIDLSEYTAEVITWTTSTATPPGVRQPNTLVIVEFDLSEASEDASRSQIEGEDGETVRAIGQATTDDVETGDTVRPVHVDELREPGAGIREPDSQEWDGYRFEPV
ncbi:nucleic acid-binding protein [Natrialba swarupiae]|uniref:Nucleic acid-binding protein n=1 Tax=Natrialba swarupiae TaxID=2448032 RepID=A0A5D5AKU2_9EURY|nr:nucleic acid-binding protein [Natrialba swarupiae]MCW8172880.1 nucleic acid-binding protein [Natrialba swarupiae]TYT61583.1 nucleic acid-binding protein [Natrialba swarupiae]